MTVYKHVHRLPPRLKTILHHISVTASFLVVLSILTIIQTVILGFIPGVWDIEIRSIPLAMIIFPTISILIIIRYFDFSSPYK